MSLLSSKKLSVPSVFFDGEKEREMPFKYEIFAINQRLWGLSGPGSIASIIEQVETWAKKHDLFEKGQQIIFDVKGESKIVFTAVPHVSKNLLKLNNKNNNKKKNKNNNNTNKRIKNREKELEPLFHKKKHSPTKREKELEGLFGGKGKTMRKRKSNKKTRKNKKMFFGLF